MLRFSPLCAAPAPSLSKTRRPGSSPWVAILMARAWLALGKASAGPELGFFRVEIPDVDLEHVDATISPSSMDMFMPYGQGPVVGPISVSSISIGPRVVDGVPNGNVVTVHFSILSSHSNPADFLKPAAISYILVLNDKSTGCQR
jgi:hypothetical protein